MKKITIILITLLATNFNLFSQRVDACGFSYAQGYKVGSGLGNQETYQQQNYSLYLNTLDKFAGCSLYTTGVREGYLEAKWNPIGDDTKIKNETLSSIGIPEDIKYLSYNGVDPVIKVHFGNTIKEIEELKEKDRKHALKMYIALRDAIWKFTKGIEK